MQPETRTLWVSFLIVAMTLGCQATGVVGDDDVGSDDDTADDDTADDDTATDDDTDGDDDSAQPVNFALAFDGEDMGSSEETEAVVLGERFTIEFWFRRTGQLRGYLLDARPPGSPSSYNWGIYVEEGSGLDFFCNTGEGNEFFHGPNPNNLNWEWHHFAVSRYGDEILLYLDGAEVLAIESAPCVVFASPLLLGTYHVGPVPSLDNAEVDEIRLSTEARYHGPFTPDRVLSQDVYTALLWHFDEGVGDVATDEVIGLELALEGVEWVEGEQQ